MYTRRDRLRALGPLAVPFGKESEEVFEFDPAAAAQYGSQVFEIVPFDFNRFSEACRDLISSDLYSADEMLPTPADFHRVLSEGTVKPPSRTLVTINWMLESTDGVAERQPKKDDTGRFQVELPARGRYLFRGRAS